jgi:enamine deaminase RidA (YjgF/YER057c/UK114 family)
LSAHSFAARWVDQGHPPVRACIESSLAVPELKVEIIIEAAK